MDKQQPLQKGVSSTDTPLTFNFGQHQVRTVEKDGEVWFVANDVCSVLSFASPRVATARLDEDEKGVHSTHTLGGDQEITVINESGLFSLILSSRKAEAKTFKRWVTHEVLPAIRKTGGYGAPDPERVRLAHSMAAEVAAAASRTVFNAIMNGDDDWRHARWLFSYTYGRDNVCNVPWAKVIGFEDVVASVDEWPNLIAGPDGVRTSDVQLANLALAIATKQAARAKNAADARAKERALVVRPKGTL